MTGPDGPSSPIYLCSLLWLQNLISCPPQPDFNQLPWKGLIAEAGAGPELQAGVRSHKGPASHCINLNVSRPQLLQKSQGTAANEAPLVKAGPLWAEPHSVACAIIPSWPSPAVHAAHLVFAHLGEDISLKVNVLDCLHSPIPQRVYPKQHCRGSWRSLL